MCSILRELIHVCDGPISECRNSDCLANLRTLNEKFEKIMCPKCAKKNVETPLMAHPYGLMRCIKTRPHTYDGNFPDAVWEIINGEGKK